MRRAEGRDGSVLAEEDVTAPKDEGQLTRRRPSCGLWHCISLVESTPLARRLTSDDGYERRLSGNLRAVRAMVAKGC
jgi:hypothetical protein